MARMSVRSSRSSAVTARSSAAWKTWTSQLGPRGTTRRPGAPGAPHSIGTARGPTRRCPPTPTPPPAAARAPALARPSRCLVVLLCRPGRHEAPVRPSAPCAWWAPAAGRRQWRRRRGACLRTAAGS
eukprot:scaffold517_cov255-Pinguiococcus_pyrenoidosus.AAC.18